MLIFKVAALYTVAQLMMMSSLDTEASFLRVPNSKEDATLDPTLLFLPVESSLLANSGLEIPLSKH